MIPGHVATALIEHRTAVLQVVFADDDRQRCVDFIDSALKFGHYTGIRWVNTERLALVEVHFADPLIRVAEKFAVVER